MPNAADPFAGQADLTTQGDTWVAVTPSDTVDLPSKPKVLWANVAGDINMAGDDHHPETFTVMASTPIQLRPSRILATGTTATGIRAIY